MNQTLLTIRAVGAEFARRTYVIVAVVSTIGAAGLVALLVWLTTFSAWWWLLGFPVVILLSIAAVMLTIMWLVIRHVRPAQSPQQKEAVRQFVDKMQRISDAASTPKFVLLFRIVRDIAAPTKEGFIGSLSTDSASLKQDFVALQKMFL